MEISEERIRAAYDAAEGNTKDVLAILLGEENAGNGKEKDTRPVTERVMTFEDACRELGDEHPFVKAYEDVVIAIDCDKEESRDVKTYLRLRIITAALNEGWKPKFEEDERRYWPWYWLYKSRQDAEDDNKGDEDRVFEIPEQLRAVLFVGSCCGFAFANYGNVPSVASPFFGSRLCYKTRELALYAAKTFYEDWLTFYCL